MMTVARWPEDIWHAGRGKGTVSPLAWHDPIRLYLNRQCADYPRPRPGGAAI